MNFTDLVAATAGVGDSGANTGAVYARDNNGNVLKFASDHEARLFGTTPLGLVSDMGPGGASGVTRPTLTNLLDASGNLKSQYQLQKGGPVNLDVNTDALSELRKRGMSTGPSQYANILNQQQGLEEQNALGKAGVSARNANSNALSTLAMRGGLSSGSRERLATQGANAEQMGMQDVRRQGMLDRLGITAGDENQKLGILQSLPGQELALGQAKTNTDLANRDYNTNVDKLNIMGALGENVRQDNAKMQEYMQKMQAYGASKTADAQANAGKK